MNKKQMLRALLALCTLGAPHLATSMAPAATAAQLPEEKTAQDLLGILNQVEALKLNQLFAFDGEKFSKGKIQPVKAAANSSIATLKTKLNALAPLKNNPTTYAKAVASLNKPAKNDLATLINGLKTKLNDELALAQAHAQLPNGSTAIIRLNQALSQMDRFLNSLQETK